MMSWCIRYLVLVAFYNISGVVDCLVSNTASTYQCKKLGCNSVGSRPVIIASRLQRGRIELHMSDPSREDEIRKKIMELKEEGKLKPNSKTKSTTDTEFSYTDTPLDRIKKERQILKNRSVADEYAEKLGSKLGGRKGKQVGRMLGIDVPTSSSSTSSSSSTATITEEEDDDDDEKRKPKLGQLDEEDLEDEYEEDDDVYTETEDERRERMVISSESASSTIDMLRRNVDEDNKDDENDDEMDEEEMLDAVAKALAKTGGIPNRSSSFDIISADDSIETVEESPKDESMPNVVSSTVSSGVKTSSVGGSWSPPKEGEKTEDAYQPKVGTWGAFPRPRNISTAYGGGKRVGAGVKTDREKQQQSIESTKERLRAYRQKMGIEVQSEKDNEAVIDEALQLASRAMQRGSYSIGVSALEKVTQYCSTKSVKGGKVFLELAMAYEAEGQTDKAIGLYAALSKSPIDEIKGNADKLLYGLEALNFMKDEAKLKDFSRKKAAETFIDATGFNDITSNFDKVYNTAYIDLDKGGQYYRMLTENAVRSTREARQILLAAVDSGEQPRMKIIQAIKSFTRHFDECLEEEKKNEAAKIVPVDYAGRPIVNTRLKKSSARSELDNLNNAIGMDGYVLSSSSQMLENLNGEWRLQLMADKKGEGVDFFNSTLIWQSIDTSEMAYTSGSKGLRSSSQSGDLNFDGIDRILSRDGSVAKAPPPDGLLGKLLGGGTAGEMTKAPQQVLLVDSALLVTRAIVKSQAADNVKDYFSVWRRAETGTYSSKQ